jgi:NAD/NADP transhydrogenase beta subunit
VNAKSVMIVPGYGLAVAKAQYAVADIIKHLTAKVNEGVVFWWLKKETRA